MSPTVLEYHLTIKDEHLDSYGHVNNAEYLRLYEEARWAFIENGGYGFKKVHETGLGPVILEIKMTFQKELLLNDHVVIETQVISCEGKIAKMAQRMIRKGELCSTAEVVFGLFDLKNRKLVKPTPDWLKALGIESAG